jgi:hypothetical protein
MSRLARAATLGKYDAAFVGGAAKSAGGLKGFVALGPGRHLTRLFERIFRLLVPIQPIAIG